MSGTDYTQTATYGLYKPTPNADGDQWGAHLNLNADTLDALILSTNNSLGNYLPIAGGTLGGPLTLAGNATAPLHAVPLQQVNTAAAGGPFLPLTGGILVGALTLAADPVNAMHAATKQYVDSKSSGGGIPDAPSDGTAYGRLNAAWTQVLPLTGGNLSDVLTIDVPPNWTDGTSAFYSLGLTLGSPTTDAPGIRFVNNDPTTPVVALERYQDGLWLSAGTDTGWQADIAMFSVSQTFYWTNVAFQGNLDVYGPMAFHGTATLSADPVQPLEVATKQYVDAQAGGIQDAPSDGSAYGRVNAAWAQVLPLSGGIINGVLTIDPLPAATWGSYQIGLKVGTTADTTSGMQFINNSSAAQAFAILRYNNGLWISYGSANSWVADVADFNTTGINFRRPLTMTTGNTITCAAVPTTTSHLANKAYVDNQIAAVAVGVSTDANNTGRNLLHNPLFNVAQRGVGPFTAQGYTLDRWYVAATLDAINVSQQPVNDANRAQIGDESAESYMGMTFTGNAGASAFSTIYQPIEDVRRLGGKTVTVSFYAQASSALKLGVSLSQNFGVGGSPSAIVNITAQNVTLSTIYTRYSLTFALPSTAGKTLGTSRGDNTALFFWFSSGATNNAQAGNIGVQSGTINIWGVQLEVGSVATPLEKPDPQQDLAKAQRFYQLASLIAANYGVAGSAAQVSNLLPVVMRGNPTVTPTNNANSNVSGLTLGGDTAKVYTSGATATATGTVWISQNMTLSADL